MFLSWEIFFLSGPSASRAHACCVNKFFRVMVDLPSAAPSIFVNVKRASLHGSNRRRRQTDFVFHRLTMIGELKLRMINAVEFPKHPDEIGLTAKQLAHNDARTVSKSFPSKMFTGKDALGFDKLLVNCRQRQLGW